MTAISGADVTIYTTATCSYCHAEKTWLQQQKVPYHEIPVDTDEAAAHQLFELSGQLSVPLTVIRRGDTEEQIVGFNQPRLAAALGL